MLRSEDMVKGYNSELDKYTTEIEKAMDSLEAVLIEGAKEESVIKPHFDGLVKSMENYTKGVRMIKQAYASRMQHPRLNVMINIDELQKL